MYAFAVERLWFLGHRVESTPFRKLPNQVYKNQKRATLTTYGHAFRQPKCPAVRMFHPYWFFCYRLIIFLPHVCSRGCCEGRWNTFMGANVTLFCENSPNNSDCWAFRRGETVLVSQPQYSKTANN